MKNILVNYEIISGESSIMCCHPFKFKSKASNEVIHSYFSDFWEGNVGEIDKGSRYFHKTEDLVVHIGTVQELTDEKFENISSLDLEDEDLYARLRFGI
ncbi:hypothetical protein [Bacillus bombysepticus]|uniref:hypothetical protein n=1 Tax=Bacillus bombysepticus TaxID=658666 RepID=UPI0030188E9E